jgi:phytoene/squalene synthetase
MQLYDQTAYQISKLVTENFSTSFSNATSLLDKNHRDAIYAIYGFVRFADEIVDTFHDRNKAFLLDKFEQDLNLAMELGISLNPVLHSFQMAVKKYKIPDEYISAFLTSMKSDLNKKQYKTKKEVNNYIYGSADVVGLMCLCVFCDGNHEKIETLKIPAMKLGSAFQKVNFLRDIRNDLNILGRTYFPQMVEKKFDKTTKKQIIEEIKADFREAYEGIKLLPSDSKQAVYLAYLYYSRLLKKLENTSPDKILTSRIRISDFRKLLILIRAKIVYKLNLI